MSDKIEPYQKKFREWYAIPANREKIKRKVSRSSLTGLLNHGPVKLRRLAKKTREILFKETGIAELKPDAIPMGRNNAGKGRKPLHKWQVDLLELRDKKGMNNLQLSEYLGINYNTTSDYVTVSMAYDRISVLNRLRLFKKTGIESHNPYVRHGKDGAISQLNPWQIFIMDGLYEKSLEPVVFAKRIKLGALPEYIRRPTKWDRLSNENRVILRKHFPGIENAAAQTYQAPTASALGEIFEKFRAFGSELEQEVQKLVSQNSDMPAGESVEGFERRLYEFIKTAEFFANVEPQLRQRLRRKIIGHDVGYLTSLVEALVENDDKLQTQQEFKQFDRKRMNEVLGGN